MTIYDDFAYVYAKGRYPDFSLQMAEYLSPVLKQLGAKPRTMLDLACGEGAFAVATAEKGVEVTGIDCSPRMLEFAAERAQKAEVEVDFIQGDIRYLEFRDRFDLITCWFDSLNYLLDPEDLNKAFQAAAGALKPGGLFIFDMNTIYGLVVNWREFPCIVETDTPDIFETHRQEFDLERSIATMKITCFVRDAAGWRRIDEEHQERGYSQEEIRGFLDAAGFQILATWGNFREMTDAEPGSGRIWYVAKKK